MTTTPPELICRPIGFVRTDTPGVADRFLAPRQPEGQAGVSRIELVAGMHLDAACHDLEGFSRIWLLAWFHLNRGWRPKVNPPRDLRRRRGVLATRSPHRPNPLALTCVPLLKVEPLRLWIGAHDLVDGTPILDIKPYLPEVDCHPDERTGWITPHPQTWRVEFSERARRQVDWLHLHYHPDFGQRLCEVLGRDPRPHRSRRIARLPDGRHRLGCGPWRCWFELHPDHVLVQAITSRHPSPELPIHRNFVLAFQEPISTNKSALE